MLKLFFVALAVFAVAYLVLPVVRRQVNTLVSTIWNAIFNLLVSPIAKQEAAYRDAVALLGRQRASLVQLMGTATTASNELTTRKAALADAIKKYADAGRLGMDEAAKNQYALAVTAARQAITTQEATVKQAQQNANNASKAMETVKRNVENFAATIQTNEGKQELTHSNQITTQALQLSTSINDKLSEAGQATAEIDQGLAVSQAELELALGDPNDRKLADLREADAAQEERKRLDAELAGTQPPAAEAK